MSEYLDSTGLALYDELIKAYINSVSGNSTGVRIATLNSAPTSSTTTYTIGATTYAFKIGDEARVRDLTNGKLENNYYIHYKLCDLVINNNTTTAYWKVEENPTSLPANGGNASTVGGHSVDSDVPSDAVFTDNNTTYKLNINGTDQGGGSTSLGTVYAPTSAGMEGQMLIANASGIPTWGSKPAYTLSEVGATMSVVAISVDTSSVCGITGAGNSGKTETIIYTNSGSNDLTVTVPTTNIQTPDGDPIELTCHGGGYCEVNYINISGVIYARGI